ncbi:hypothetical protein GCM10017750_13980 [Streptomyces racemochromogenes]
MRAEGGEPQLGDGGPGRSGIGGHTAGGRDSTDPRRRTGGAAGFCGARSGEADFSAARLGAAGLGGAGAVAGVGG